MGPDYESQLLEQLYHQHSDAIYKFILYMVSDAPIAEDLTHDTFLGAFKNLQQFSRSAQ